MTSDVAAADPRALVVQVGDAACELLARPEVAVAWDRPSALEGMTVGALSAHLVRAFGATIAYLDRPAGDGPLLDAVEYFHQALEAPIHGRVKEVSASEASIGPAELVERARRVADQLRERLPVEPADRTIGALEGRRLSLDDFCRTRLIEVLVHVDDLAASVRLDVPPVPTEATGAVVDVLVGMARRRHGDWPVIRALGRRERAADGVFPVI